MIQKILQHAYISHYCFLKIKTISDEKNPVKCHSKGSIDNPYKSNLFSAYNDKSNAIVSESLQSLIDGVIGTLVHRERRWIKAQNETHPESPLSWNERQKYTNILSLGYKLASDLHDGRNCNDLPVGVRCDQPNAMVSYMKSSKAMSLLHREIGDDELRILLLNSTLLIPIDKQKNYLQVCGSPIRTENDVSSNPSKRTKNNELLLSGTNNFIPRFKMFYSDSFFTKVGLPRSHILNNINASSLDILRSIFCVNGESLGHRKMKRVKREGIKLCSMIRNRNVRFNFLRPLDKFCPLASMSASLSCLVSYSSPSMQVVKFVTESVRAVFPVSYFGNEKNFTTFLRHIKTFIIMRRYEQMPQNYVLHGIRICEFQWLDGCKLKNRRSLSDFQTLSKLVACALQFVICKFVIPLVRSCFYVTETENSGNEIKYYRKPIWCQIRRLSCNHLLQRQYSEVKDSKILKQLLTDQQMGCSKLRILPKKDGIRPIAMLSKRTYVDFSNTSEDKGLNQRKSHRRFFRALSTNMILKRSFDVLKYEYERKPDAFGNGVLGLDQIYPMFLKFVKDLRTHKPNASIFFACADIYHCYDTMNQEKLFEIIDEIILEEQYLSQKYSIFYPFRSINRVYGKYITKVGRLDDFQQFHDFVETLSKHYSSSIFVDGVNCGIIKKSSVTNMLREHIFKHVVFLDDSFGPRHFLQSDGIPQGSILSSFLCNYFYGKIENTSLNKILTTSEGHKHLMLRLMDDSIFITTDKSSSERFMKLMSEGYPEMGMKINPSKSRVNYDLQLNSVDGNESKVQISRGEWFPWCGMLLNMISCEVRVDYSRFRGSSARNSLTVDYVKNGDKLRVRMKSFIRPRCQPIFFDAYINSMETVLSNFYQAVLFAAIKTISYIDCLPGKTCYNELHFQRCIDELIEYGYYLVKRRLSRSSGNFDETQHCLSKARAVWLGKHAFVKVLGKRKTQFIGILTYLNKNLSNFSETWMLKPIVSNALCLFDIDSFDI